MKQKSPFNGTDPSPRRDETSRLEQRTREATPVSDRTREWIDGLPTKDVSHAHCGLDASPSVPLASCPAPRGKFTAAQHARAAAGEAAHRHRELSRLRSSARPATSPVYGALPQRPPAELEEGHLSGRNADPFFYFIL